MNAKNLSQYLAVENRINTICRYLILDETDHFKVNYDTYNVTITAFIHSHSTAKWVAEFMKHYSEPMDVLDVQELSNMNGKFWTVDLRIPLE